jgi:TonB family protein
MRWVCSAEDPCDCHLVPAGSGDQDLDDAGKRDSSAAVAQGITCHIDFFVVPAYPVAARKARKQGSVSAILVLSTEGTVQEVRIQSGDPELAKAARLALQQWRFTPRGGLQSIPVYVKFALSENPAGSVTGTSLLNLVVTAQPVR